MGAQRRADSRQRRVREVRVAKGLSQTRLARLAGISKRTLERIEGNADGKVTLWHLVNIALVLDCELEELLDERWLSYRQTDVSIPPPERTTLNDPDAPEPRFRTGRERVRRRSG